MTPKIEKIITPDTVAIVSLFLLALILRIIYLSEFSHYPTFYHLNIDNEYYNLWAKRILAEGFFGNKVYEMTPLYAYLLAFLYKFVTMDLFGIRLFQAVAGSCTVVLIFSIAKILFGFRTALLSGVIAAFYGVFILFDGMVMKTFLSVFLATLTLYLLLKTEKREPVYLIIPGLCLGILCLVRENALLLIAGIPLCFFIQEGFGKRPLKKSVFFVLSAMFAIMPVTVRNYVVGEEFVPITSGGGEIFYMSYYEGCDGTYVAPDFVKTANPLSEHEEFRQEAIRRTGREMSRKESSDYWSNEGLNYIKEDPRRLLWLLYKKFVVFWNFYEIPDNQNYYFMKVLTDVMKFTLGFGIVAPLGILGVVVSLGHWKRLLPVYTFFLVYMASVLLVFNISRYRAPALPALIIFSAFFIEWFIASFNQKKISRCLFAAIAMVFLFLVINHRIGGRDPYKSGFRTEYSKLGKSYMLQNDLAGGKRSYSKIVELEPASFDGYFGLGRIALKERKFKEAIAHLEKAVRAAPDNYRGYFALAIAYRETGRLEEAQRAMKYGYMNK